MKTNSSKRFKEIYQPFLSTLSFISGGILFLIGLTGSPLFAIVPLHHAGGLSSFQVIYFFLRLFIPAALFISFEIIIKRYPA